MNSKILTIVVPSYNVEKTLRETLNSFILENNELFNKMEIIIVNDGSTDNTAVLVDEYIKKYPKVFKTINKENGGHGSTINKGLELATGKYFKVVDGDDWLNKEQLEKYIEFLLKQDADLICTDYIRYSETEKKFSMVESSKDIPYNKLVQWEDVCDNYDFHMLSCAVKTNLINNGQIVLDEHCYYTDVEFDTFLIKNIRTIYYLPLNLYVYRVGQINQSISANGWFNHRKDHEKIAIKLVEFYKSYSIREDKQEKKENFLLNRAIHSCIGHYKIGLVFNYDKICIFLKELKQFDELLKNTDENVYNQINKNIIVRAIKATNYSSFVYYMVAIIAKHKRKR